MEREPDTHGHSHEDLRGRFVTIHSTSWRDMRTGQLDKVQKMARLGSHEAHRTFFNSQVHGKSLEAERVYRLRLVGLPLCCDFLGVGGVQPGASAPPDDPLMSGELQEVHIHMFQVILESSFQTLCQTLKKLKAHKHREVWAGTVVQTRNATKSTSSHNLPPYVASLAQDAGPELNENGRAVI